MERMVSHGWETVCRRCCYLFIIYLVTFLPSGNAQECLSIRFSFPGSTHEGLTGIYRLQPGLHENEPFYKHECAEIYIYKYNGRVIRWLIGPEAGSLRAYALSHDTGNIDDNTRWHLWFPEESIWRVDDGATYGCVEFCPLVQITSTSAPSNVQGIYDYVSVSNGRPVYRHRITGMYIYHYSEVGATCGRWNIGNNVGSPDASLYRYSAAETPAFQSSSLSWTSSLPDTTSEVDLLVACIDADPTSTVGVLSTTLPPTHPCGGRPIPNGGATIVNGQPASYHGKWPFMVSIIKKNGEFKCGGVILNERWILTAAHCLQDGSPWEELTILLGAYDIRISELERQAFRILDVVIPEDFQWVVSPFYLNNDVALAELSHTIVYTPYIQPVCLPQPHYDSPLPFVDIASQSEYSDCHMVGWGKTTQSSTAGNRLQEATMDLLSIGYCIPEYLSAYNHWAPETVAFCTRSTSVDNPAKICQGDSGSPLLCRNADASWTVVGVASWSITTCVNPVGGNNIPSVYSDVTRFTEFITDYISTVV